MYMCDAHVNKLLFGFLLLSCLVSEQHLLEEIRGVEHGCTSPTGSEMTPWSVVLETFR